MKNSLVFQGITIGTEIGITWEHMVTGSKMRGSNGWKGTSKQVRGGRSFFLVFNGNVKML